MSVRLRNQNESNFSSTCKCLIHDQLTEGREEEVTAVYNVAKRKVSMDPVKELIRREVMTKKRKYICNVCWEHGRRLLESAGNTNDFVEVVVEDEIVEPDVGEELAEELPTNDETAGINTEIDALIEMLQRTDPAVVSTEKLTNLICVIGTLFIKPAIVKDSKSLTSKYKDIEVLQKLNPKEFLEERKVQNPLLIHLINSMIGVDIFTAPNGKFLYSVCMLIEFVYHLKNENLILPHCFLVNLIETFVSGSKTVTAINGKLLPAGSDTSYRKWLSMHGSTELIVPTYDVAVFFDNIGKYIVKNYRVRSERNTSPNVVSAVINLRLQHPSSGLINIENDISLKPDTWQGDRSEEEVQDLMEEYISKREEDFRVYRYNYINNLFQFLSGSHQMDEEIARNLQQIQESHLTRMCSACGELYEARKMKCNSCGATVVTRSYTSDDMDDKEVEESSAPKLPKYFNVGQGNIDNRTDITMGEPILLNPNSYINIREILKELKSRYVKGDRSWFFVGADGPPYCLMRRILAESPDLSECISILSGKGHLGMNQMKTYFRILEKIMLEPLAKDVFNFDTTKSFSYFVNCKDTHKAWQAFETFLHGTIMELIRMYCSECEHELPTPYGFLQWQSNVKTPVLRLVCDLTLSIGLGIYVMRVGVRNNDEKCCEAGRMKSLNMFFGFNHPIYREVEYNELRNKVLYPSDVAEVQRLNTAFNDKDCDLLQTHQGADFKLEERVKSMKRMSPKGKMGSKMWLRVARSHDEVDKAVSNGMSLLNQMESDRIRYTDLSKETNWWRAILRSSNYLKVDDMRPMSINGDYLSVHTSDILVAMKQKRLEYFEMAKSTPLEKIRYGNLSILVNEEMDEIHPYVYELLQDQY